MPISYNNVDASSDDDDRFLKDEEIHTNRYITEEKEPKRDLISLSMCLYHHLAAPAKTYRFHFL